MWGIIISLWLPGGCTAAAAAASGEFAQLDSHATSIYLNQPQSASVVFEPGPLPDQQATKALVEREVCAFLSASQTMKDIVFPLPYKVSQWQKGKGESYYAVEVPELGAQVAACRGLPTKAF